MGKKYRLAPPQEKDVKEWVDIIQQSIEIANQVREHSKKMPKIQRSTRKFHNYSLRRIFSNKISFHYMKFLILCTGYFPRKFHNYSWIGYFQENSDVNDRFHGLKFFSLFFSCHYWQLQKREKNFNP